jgi:hypothetical protein
VKEARKDASCEATLYLRIAINSERAEISTDRKGNHGPWDDAGGGVLSSLESQEPLRNNLADSIYPIDSMVDDFLI